MNARSSSRCPHGPLVLLPGGRRGPGSDTALAAALRVWAAHGIGGAPLVDSTGRCVGIGTRLALFPHVPSGGVRLVSRVDLGALP